MHSIPTPAPSDRDDEYTVSIVKYGTRETRRRELFLNYDLYGEPDGPARLDYFFWIARNQHRTVVIDTGFSSAAGQARGRTMLMHPSQALAALGVDSAAVDTIVLTHAHYDHVGNVGLFPYSAVLLAERELEFWTGPLADRRQFAAFSESVEIDELVAARKSGRLTTFTGTARPAPGIEVHELGGHTPGMSVVTVDTNAGTVLLASDSMHLYEQFEREMPFSGITDLAGMYQGYARIRQLLDGGVTHLVSGHDPSTLERFTPSPVLPGLAATIGTTTADPLEARQADTTTPGRPT
ncbi:MAG: N-acyl homoserine lactonase family protein [Rhodococcus sp. (in: high G+C Gram-positive bacteria)]